MADILIRNPVNKPWARQRIWKQKPTVPSYDEILSLCTSIYQIPQHRALFALAYLTGGRLTEYMPLKYLRKVQYKKDEKGKVIRNEHGSPIQGIVEKVPLDYPGITRRDIDFAELDVPDSYGDITKMTVMILNMQNRKNKTQKMKTIPVPVKKEGDLILELCAYADTLEYEQPLFPFSIHKAESIINKTGLNAHFLRDIRATHMAMNYHFTEYQLIQVMGWTDGRPAMRYVKRDWTRVASNYL